MGYYTRFDIEIKTPMTRECVEQIVDRLNVIIGDKDCFEITDSDGGFKDTALATWNLKPYGDMKWYDWEKDVAQLTEEFPDVEFRVEGDGEDKDDWWVALFKGKRKQIKYCSPPSDEWED